MIHQPDGSDEFIRPYLAALKRVRQRRWVSQEDLLRRAERLLTETFGPADEPIRSGFGAGHVGMISEHTYYFDGFALLLPLPFGTAVAVRAAPSTRAFGVIEGGSGPFPLSPAAEVRKRPPVGPSLLESQAGEVLRHALGADNPAQVAVVTSVPACCEDGYWASLAVAACRALEEGPSDGCLGRLRDLARAIETVIVRPYGVAPMFGAAFCVEGAALLVDTLASEHIPVELPPVETMAWGLVDTRRLGGERAELYRKRRSDAQAVVEHLQKVGFAGLDSIRDLEHRHIELAIKRLPKRLHGALHYLAGENRRVQRLVLALRKLDCQIFGAFLLMSQSSLAKHWREQNQTVEELLERSRAVEGIDGVRRTGREFGSAVLVAGRPLAVAPFLDRQTRPAAGSTDERREAFFL